MIPVNSYTDFINKTKNTDKIFLLLYKAGSEQSNCAFKNLQGVFNEENNVPFYTANMVEVKDIHLKFNISSVPSLLIFEKNVLVSVIKGCNDSSFYKALIDNAVFQATNNDDAKPVKRVTVYSTPTCSWCNTLKNWLRKNNIQFTDIDISANEKAAQDLVKRSGQQGVPQTDINGQIVVGFDQKRLKELLDIQ